MTRYAMLMTVLLTTIGAAHAIDLLPGAFFAPGSLGRHEVGDERTILRTTHDFLLYVTEPGPVGVTLGCRKIGGYQTEATASIEAPTGELLAEGSAPIGESTTISFEATQIGPHVLRAGAGRNGFTLDATGAKLLIPAGADGRPFEGISHAAPVYLFVPPGAQRFTVELGGQGSGETAAARVLGPDGAPVAALSTAGGMTDRAIISAG